MTNHHESHTMRLLIAGTPRSGNTWLRLLLAHQYRVADRAVHHPDEVAWDALPSSYLLQLHWQPTTAFLTHMQNARVRPVALARHPLDVLVSILHFCVYEPDCRRWLDGVGGDERGIFAASPTSPVVADYLAGPRGQALLAVSRDWWQRPDALRLRYEDLVADPVAALNRLETDLGPPAPGQSAAGSVAATALDKLRPLTTADHFWQGRAGLWRSLFPADVVDTLRPAIQPSLDLFGYDCVADPALDRRQADANWCRLMGESLAAKIARYRQAQERFDRLHADHVERGHALDRLARQHDATLNDLAELRYALRLAGPVGWLARCGVGVARSVRRWVSGRQRSGQ